MIVGLFITTKSSNVTLWIRFVWTKKPVSEGLAADSVSAGTKNCHCGYADANLLKEVSHDERIDV